MIFLDTFKANKEISKLGKDLADMKADRDLQLTKLAEFEKTNKDFIESAQTAEAMKQAHQTALDSLKADYEGKLAAKDKELADAKAEAAKTISTVKESVAEETIRLVASQGTNVVLESVVEEMTPEKAKATFDSLTGEVKQNFYNQNSKLILSAKSTTLIK